jgi:hypothetical protein
MKVPSSHHDGAIITCLILLPLKPGFSVMVATKRKVHLKVTMLSFLDNFFLHLRGLETIGVALPPTWAVQLRRPRALAGRPVQ